MQKISEQPLADLVSRLEEAENLIKSMRSMIGTANKESFMNWFHDSTGWLDRVARVNGVVQEPQPDISVNTPSIEELIRIMQKHVETEESYDHGGACYYLTGLDDAAKEILRIIKR